MPRKNGLEVVQTVKKIYEKHAKKTGTELELPKFVFLTAFNTKAMTAYLGQNQVTEVYEKPLLDDQLYAILTKHAA